MTDPNPTLDLGATILGLRADGVAELFDATRGDPPPVDGVEIGAPHMAHSPHHAGEMHPDGDELLYLISGRMDVVLEEESGERRVELHPGRGFVVPRGIWHRVEIHEPGRILYMTPGPNGQHRPASGTPHAG